MLHVAAAQYTIVHLLLPQLRSLVDRGFHVTVACARGPHGFDPALEPFEPQPLAFPRYPSPIGLARAGMALHRLVEQRRPDIVHLHTPTAAIPSRVALVPSRFRRGTNRPRIVYTVHGYFHDWEHWSAGGVASHVAESLLSHATDMSLFQSTEDLDEARRHRYDGDLVYLGNGVQDEWFTGDRHRWDRTGPIRAVCVARLVRMKGILDLVSAMRSVRNMTMTIVGDEVAGASRRPVGQRARAMARGLEADIRFTGSLPPGKVRQLLADADLFVLPSWREGVPRSVIEAMAMGLPVVASAIKGTRELVEDRVSGWLVPPRQPAALAAALQEAADAGRLALAAMGRAGFDRAAARWRESCVVERLVAAYARLGVCP